MGTCMSKKKKKHSKKPKQPSGRKPAHELDQASRNPPEEEKVKEVLSETPTPSFPTKPIESVAPIKPEVLAPETLEPPVPEKNTTAKKPEECSIDVSETVSMSESASMAVTEDSNATEVQQPLRRTPVYRKREDLSGRRSPSPARKREASPGRRTENASSRVPGRTVSVAREAGSPAASERRHRVKRVSGELLMQRNNARRSRSPAARAEPIGRPTANRSNSKRAPPGTGQNLATRREEARRTEGDGSEKGEQKQPQQLRNGSGPALTDESIDNPLVSLECFIFL